jgi:hypothetical protein
MSGLEIRGSVPSKVGVLPRSILDPRASASRVRVDRAMTPLQRDA